jgi:hypothetical protein
VWLIEVMVTVALADCVETEALCAVTVTGLVGATDGALYKPVEEMVPTDKFPATMPSTSQFTAVLVVPEIVAVNCCEWPTCTLALPGEIVTDGSVGAGRIVTAALADCVEAMALCAVTTTGLVGTVAGALYKPIEEIVPTKEFPPAIPPTNQFTAVLVVPETVAVNCCERPTCTPALPGEIVTDTGVGAGAGAGAGAGKIVRAALASIQAKVLSAITVTGIVGTVDGAMYKPLDEIVPTTEFPPATPVTSHFTALFFVPETVAMNCWEEPTCRLALLGEIDTETLRCPLWPNDGLTLPKNAKSTRISVATVPPKKDRLRVMRTRDI